MVIRLRIDTTPLLPRLFRYGDRTLVFVFTRAMVYAKKVIVKKPLLHDFLIGHGECQSPH